MPKEIEAPGIGPVVCSDPMEGFDLIRFIKPPPVIISVPEEKKEEDPAMVRAKRIAENLKEINRRIVMSAAGGPEKKESWADKIQAQRQNSQAMGLAA